MASPLAEQQVHDPAPADVRAITAAMGQDGFILATRIL
jgi:hypothetical protein